MGVDVVYIETKEDRPVSPSQSFTGKIPTRDRGLLPSLSSTRHPTSSLGWTSLGCPFPSPLVMELEWIEDRRKQRTTTKGNWLGLTFGLPFPRVTMLSIVKVEGPMFRLSSSVSHVDLSSFFCRWCRRKKSRSLTLTRRCKTFDYSKLGVPCLKID